MDDTQEGHPGAVVVSVALAAAERTRASGATLLRAIAAGYDVCERIGRATKPSPQRYREVYGFGSFQAVSAAATAAVILGLDSERTVHALGLGAVSAPIPSHRKAVSLSQRPLSWVKNHYGWVAMGGLVAADLAADGFKASVDVLDGDDGFWRMIGSDQFRPDAAVESLGTRFSVTETGFKPYSCCRYIQSSVDALLEVVAEAGVRPQDIEAIHVRSFHRLAEFMDPAPRGFMESMFSLPHSLACAALGIPSGPAWSSEQTLADKAVNRLAKLVTFEIDEGADRAFFEERRYVSTVEIRVGSRSWTRHRRTTRGDPEDPMEEAAIRHKFHHLCGPQLGSAAAVQLERAIDGIGEAQDLSAVTGVLRRSEDVT
jgi:2-methylcitrate dehydratase PrpD